MTDKRTYVILCTFMFIVHHYINYNTMLVNAFHNDDDILLRNLICLLEHDIVLFQSK